MKDPILITRPLRQRRGLISILILLIMMFLAVFYFYIVYCIKSIQSRSSVSKQKVEYVPRPPEAVIKPSIDGRFTYEHIGDVYGARLRNCSVKNVYTGTELVSFKSQQLSGNWSWRKDSRGVVVSEREDALVILVDDEGEAARMLRLSDLLPKLLDDKYGPIDKTHQRIWCAYWKGRLLKTSWGYGSISLELYMDVDNPDHPDAIDGVIAVKEKRYR